MKLSAILIFLGTMAVTANSYSQKTKIDLNLQTATSLNEIFREIEKNSEFIFIYDAKSIDTETRKSIVVEGEKIEPILDKILEGTGINYRIFDRQIVLYKKDQSDLNPTPALNGGTGDPQQTRVVRGTIKDTKGETVIGATVLVKGTTTGASSNVDGSFQINVPVNNQVLQITYIGFKPVEIDVTGKESVDIVMEALTTELEEVVVVGYGTQKKITVTGAITTVSAAAIKQAPVGQISTALVGKTPGLLVVQRNGEPGMDQTTIRIRGVSTYSGATDPLIIVDGVEAQTFNNIDPNEIENLTVLKDASSTAVYGLRGANGVILVTTKRGRLGKPQVSFTTNTAMLQFTDVKTYFNAYDYASGWNEGLKYDTYYTGSVYTPQFTQNDLDLYKNHEDPIFHSDVDWMDYMLKDQSFQYQNNLNIRGGTENVKYFVSIGQFSQGGMLNNTTVVPDYYDVQIKYGRYNFRSNFDVNITKRLSAVINITSTIENKKGVGTADNVGAASLIRAASIANPIATPGIVDGKFIRMQSTTLGTINPVRDAMYLAGYSRRYKNYITALTRFNYDLGFITKGLKTHITLSYQSYNMQNLISGRGFATYTAIKQLDGSALFVPSATGPYYFTEETGKNRRTYLEAGLDYSRSFGVHTLTGVVLYTQSKYYDPGLAFVIPSGYQGLVGRVAYDYDGRYLAEVDLGYNGTENFAPGNRFGFFPAASLGWVLSKESFFPENNVVTFAKLRASYGEVGNDQIGGTRFLYNPSSYTYKNNTYYLGTVGISSFGYQGAYEGKVGNPDLTWERAKKTDIGIELSLFKEKIRIIADYFYEKRENILTTPNTVPFITGIGGNIPAQNLGKMKNSGVDGEITYNGKAGKFNYWIKGNYTYAHNEVLFRDEVYNPYPYLYSTGQMNGQTFGSISQGLYNEWEEVSDWARPKSNFQNNRIQPGDIKYKDINGDGVIDTYDRAPIGYSDFPEIVYGISFGGDYKGFDFNAVFQGAAHVTFQAAGNYVNPWNGLQNVPEYFDDTWTYEKYKNGEPIYWMRYAYNNSNAHTYGLRGDFQSVDAQYFRLRNAEIAYTFGKNNVFSAVGISSVRLYANATNLFYFTSKRMREQYTHVDPENTGTYLNSGNYEAYPRTRVINLGLNVNF